MVKYVTWGYFLISLKIKKSDGFVQCFFWGQNLTTSQKQNKKRVTNLRKTFWELLG